MHGWLCMGSCQLTWAGAEETNRCVDQFDVSEIGALEHGSDVVGIVGFATWRGSPRGPISLPILLPISLLHVEM